MSASLMGAGTESQMTFLYGDSDKVPSRGPGGPGRGHGGRDRRLPGDGDRRPPGDGPPDDAPPPLYAQANYDRPRWNPLADEYFRARGLCDWIKEKRLGGNGWGYEGIVRMNAGFEMIWCDFNSTSLKLVSNLDAAAPLLGAPSKPKVINRQFGEQAVLMGGERSQMSLHPRADLISAEDEGPHSPGMADRREPFRRISIYMWFTGAARRYGAEFSGNLGAGETRARIDTCGYFSFYNPALSDQQNSRAQTEQKSLNISAEGRWTGPMEGVSRATALKQLMRRRRDHRANHVSEGDGELMYRQVERNLRDSLNASTHCSGISWDAVANEISALYARNLHNLHGTLEATTSHLNANYRDTRTWLEQVRGLTHWLLLPHFEYPPGPYTPELLRKDFSTNSPAALAAMRRCQDWYEIEDPTALNSGEKLLSTAVSETLQSICRTLLNVGLAVEYTWLSYFNEESSDKSEQKQAVSETNREAGKWTSEIEELMAWLGWVDQWTACAEPCGPSQVCYIPIWPVGGWGWGRDAEKYLWRPACVHAMHYPP